MRLGPNAGRGTTRAFMRVLFLPLLFMLLSACSPVEPTPFRIDDLIGRQAPDFTLRDFTGVEHRLSHYRGRQVILTFWASWTPVSATHLAALETLHKKSSGNPDRPVILAISADRSQAAAEAFVKDLNISYPLLFDDDFAVTKKTFSVFMVPTTIIIDRHGLVREILYGEQAHVSVKSQS